MKGIMAKVVSAALVCGMAGAVALAELTPEQTARFIELKIQCQKMKMDASRLREEMGTNTGKVALTDVLGRLDEINSKLENIINNP